MVAIQKLNSNITNSTYTTQNTHPESIKKTDEIIVDKSNSNTEISISNQGRVLEAVDVEFAKLYSDNNDIPHYLREPLESFTPDPYASSGSVYDFLTISDKIELKNAYEQAVANNTSTKPVKKAAFMLGIDRHREAKIANGTIYFDSSPTSKQPQSYQTEVTYANIKETVSSEYKSLLQAKDIFGHIHNDLLDQNIFVKSAHNILNLNLNLNLDLMDVLGLMTFLNKPE